jgi:hypothetical protein
MNSEQENSEKKSRYSYVKFKSDVVKTLGKGLREASFDDLLGAIKQTEYYQKNILKGGGEYYSRIQEEWKYYFNQQTDKPTLKVSHVETEISNEVKVNSFEKSTALSKISEISKKAIVEIIEVLDKEDLKKTVSTIGRSVGGKFAVVLLFLSLCGN